MAMLNNQRVYAIVYLRRGRPMSENPTSARADNSIEPVWRIVAVACEHLRKFGSIRLYGFVVIIAIMRWLYKPTWNYIYWADFV